MDIRAFETDEDKAATGVWVDYQDARFKIRHTNTKAYRKAVSKAGKGKAPNRLRKDVELQTRFGQEVIADAVLIDWEGVTENGQPLPCTRENKLRLLALSEDLRNFLAEEAQDMANFLAEGDAADGADIKSEG